MRSHVISSRLLLSIVCLAFLLLAGCGQSSGGSPTPTPTGATPTSTLSALTQDAYGTPIAYPTSAPQRIVSLVPNISEILGSLHLDSHVVGVDFYTNYPADLTALPKVSDAYGKYNIEQIVALKPDLVLSYGQDTKQYDSQLQSVGERVVDLPAGNLTLVLQEILTVGRLTFTQDTATSLVAQLQQQIKQVEQAVAGTTPPTVMIELDDSTPGKPYVFGGGSFGDELAQDANAVNIFHSDTSGGGFPQVTDEAVISANPQFIILTEDPAYGGSVSAVYKRPHWSSVAALQQHQVYRINPNLIGRPGPRLVEGLQCLAQIVHPAQFPGSLPAYCSGTVERCIGFQGDRKGRPYGIRAWQAASPWETMVGATLAVAQKDCYEIVDPAPAIEERSSAHPGVTSIDHPGNACPCAARRHVPGGQLRLNGHSHRLHRADCA